MNRTGGAGLPPDGKAGAVIAEPYRKLAPQSQPHVDEDRGWARHHQQFKKAALVDLGKTATVVAGPGRAQQAEIRRALWARLRELTGAGRGVVLTTHYLEEADALADRIVVLDRGRIIAQGSPAEIKFLVPGRS